MGNASIAPDLRQRRGRFRCASWRDWLYLFGQVTLIGGVELSDDAFHALHPLGNAAGGVAHALQVMHFEMAHGLWIEPGVQEFFEHTHEVLGQAIGWSQIVPIANAIYGQGHVFFTLSFALWIYFARRGLFPFLRNVFLLTNVLAVAIYELFPLAPPRLAQGLRWAGHPFHAANPTWSGVKLGFNEFAAMPSLHVAWALIVGLTVAWAARPLVMRVLGLVYPLIMAVTVIVTGNHYVSDALGAVGVVAIACAGSLLIEWRTSGASSLGAVIRALLQRRRAVSACEQADVPVETRASARAA